MASLIDGKFTDRPIATMENGQFLRQDSQFRNAILEEEASPGRYHLYVSYACPWAHRTLIVRSLKKLENVITVSVTNAYMGHKGWTFASGHDLEYLADVYRGADPNFSGKVTVPVLWDNINETIVNNESSEILRILNSSFNKFTDSRIDLCPAHLKREIDEMNDFIYESVNNGVYKAGFAGTQVAYEAAFEKLFSTLDKLDTLLSENKYLLGDKITECDIRLFTTLIRFDPVYYVHFKCNKSLIREFPHLQPYLKSLYQIPAIRGTCHFDHIKEHYFKSHKFLNPSKIIPSGPDLKLETPHFRGAPEFFLIPEINGWQ